MYLPSLCRTRAALVFLSSMGSRRLVYALLAGATLALASCGGGSGGVQTPSASAPPAPPASPPPGPSAPPPSTYAIGGSVSGLLGSGLVLQNNGVDDQAIAADGSFHFSTALASGAGFAVTVKSQPNILNVHSNSVSAYRIDAGSGALTQITVPPVSSGGVDPYYLAVEPTGKFAYAVHWGSSTVVRFNIDATSGALSPIAGSAIATGLVPRWMVFSR